MELSVSVAFEVCVNGGSTVFHANFIVYENIYLFVLLLFSVKVRKHQ